MKAAVCKILSLDSPDDILYGIEFQKPGIVYKSYASLGGKVFAIKDKKKVQKIARSFNKYVEKHGNHKGWVIEKA